MTGKAKTHMILSRTFGLPMEFTEDGTPVLKAIPRADWVYGWRVYCVFCQCWHVHGMIKGTSKSHRVAHCYNDEQFSFRTDSPYSEKGYYLKKVSKSELRELIEFLWSFPRMLKIFNKKEEEEMWATVNTK